jgi:predicted amidohydrolase
VGLLNKAKEKAIEFTQAQGGALADMGMAKAREALGLLNEALPLLKEAGCSPSEVEVEVTLPPKVVAKFATSDVSEEAIARITAENPHRTLACAILKTLQQGARLQKAIAIGRMRASTLDVEISLVPCLKLTYTNE